MGKYITISALFIFHFYVHQLYACTCIKTLTKFLDYFKDLFQVLYYKKFFSVSYCFYINYDYIYYQLIIVIKIYPNKNKLSINNNKLTLKKFLDCQPQMYEKYLQSCGLFIFQHQLYQHLISSHLITSHLSRCVLVRPKLRNSYSAVKNSLETISYLLHYGSVGYGLFVCMLSIQVLLVRRALLMAENV